MARLHKPNEVAKLVAGKTNKAKHDLDIPKNPNPVGHPPFHLPNEAVKVWHELVDHIPNGVVTQGDRLVLEITSCLMAEFRADAAQFPSSKMSQLISCLGRLGLTPSDRVKLGMRKNGKNENPFDDF